MNLTDVMEEVAGVLRGVAGLRKVHPHPIARTAAAAASAVVSYPEQIEYGITYGRRFDRIVGLSVALLVGTVTEKTARDRLAVLLDPAGPASISAVAALEAHAWESCDELTVADAAFDTVEIAGVDHLAAMLSLNAAGPGRP